MLDPKERFRKYSLRSVFDGILYIVKTGIQWRMLPSDFAPWQTVYYYFSKWKNDGSLEEIRDSCSIFGDSSKIIGEIEKSRNIYTGFTECLLFTAIYDSGACLSHFREVMTPLTVHI